MNLQQLEYIIALDRTRSFSKAAEMCFVTQATLSTMVKRLEEELEVVIFDRKSNPIVTTDCGQDIIEVAKKVVYHTNQIRNLAFQVKGRIEGQISIGIIPTIANSLLELIIKPLITKYPDLQLKVIEITTDNILRQLKEGSIDAGIIATPPSHLEDFETEILYYEELLLFGNTDKKRKFFMPEEVVKNKIWLLEEGHCLRDQTISLCSLKQKKTKENFLFEANSLETLLNMVDNFGGLTLVPELYVKQLSEPRREKVIAFKAPHPVREVSLVFYRPYAKYRLTQLLSTEIRELVKPHLSTSKLKNSEQVIVMS
jgi:LysR family hydrogen peroxide-inducible transcriptional activator